MASPVSSSNGLQFDSLEDIHIFILSNILRRPIIVIAGSLLVSFFFSLYHLTGCFLLFVFVIKDSVVLFQQVVFLSVMEKGKGICSTTRPSTFFSHASCFEVFMVFDFTISPPLYCINCVKGEFAETCLKPHLNSPFFPTISLIKTWTKT